MKKITNIITTLFIISLFMLTSCAQQPSIPQPRGTFDPAPSIQLDTADQVATQEMKKFSSIEELKEFLRRQQQSPQVGYDEGLAFAPRVMAQSAVAESADMAGGARPSQAVTKFAGEYSSTNVQYQDVDEADFVKNDGRYIYMIKDNSIHIVDAYDAKNAKIISTINIDDENQDEWRKPAPKQLFIDNNQLAVFIEKHEEAFYFERYDIEPRTRYKQKTVVQIYDITNRKSPTLRQEFEITGRYHQSRLVDGIIYAVTQENAQDGVYINQPMITDVRGEIAMPEIYYFDNPENNYQFNTITSIDMSSRSVVDAQTLMLGYSNTLMVSPNNIYIAYQKQKHWNWWRSNTRYEKERFTDVILPLLPQDMQSEISAILKTRVSEEKQWQKISKIFADFYAEMKEDDQLYDQYEDLFTQIADALEEYDTKKELEERKTVIHKINIDNGKLTYKAKGEVYGNLLNQFSLDEYDDHLRLATTVNIWNNRRVQYNNVYVLNSQMDKVGEVTGIAEDERIYSTRFVGDRLYMVTFRQTDPFFVIDLSNPSNPNVLGELKIPGFSNYLHPFDESHIIGVGKETKETEWGFTAEGIKIALFDVTDVNNPKQKDKLIIGDRGSNSEALSDHKAFLFDKEKKLLVLPVSEVTKRDRINEWRYSNHIWNGAYVLKVDEAGFDTLGKVTHSSQKSDYFQWRTQATVRRSLYMDDNLYTISDKYIKINDLGEDAIPLLKSLKLPGKEVMDRAIIPEPIVVEPMMMDTEILK